jgi:hypothetical protein
MRNDKECKIIKVTLSKVIFVIMQFSYSVTVRAFDINPLHAFVHAKW